MAVAEQIPVPNPSRSVRGVRIGSRLAGACIGHTGREKGPAVGRRGRSLQPQQRYHEAHEVSA